VCVCVRVCVRVCVSRQPRAVVAAPLQAPRAALALHPSAAAAALTAYAWNGHSYCVLTAGAHADMVMVVPMDPRSSQRWRWARARAGRCLPTPWRPLPRSWGHASGGGAGAQRRSARRRLIAPPLSAARAARAR